MDNINVYRFTGRFSPDMKRERVCEQCVTISVFTELLKAYSPVNLTGSSQDCSLVITFKHYTSQKTNTNKQKLTHRTAIVAHIYTR